MPEGGELKIRARRVDGLIEVSFQDDGSGITDEILQLLFEPLFTTKNKGTGLGLSICQQIVSNHGGSIEVTSKPDHGSTFLIKLPLNGRES
jgi:signal transduction histidine kinase